MDVMRDLAISPQLESLLRKVKDVKPIHTPRLNVATENSRAIPQDEVPDLPNNIDSYPFSKYVQEQFNDQNQWGLLSGVLPRALTKTVANRDEKAAVALNRMILRILMDKNLTGIEYKLFCDFLITRILVNYHMRDEALCQIASLTWNNFDEAKRKKLWVLLSNCLSCIIPSTQFYNYLLKYVSDHGTEGYDSVLQHKMLWIPRNQSPEEGRLYPPSVLEWQANSLRSPISVKVHLPNGTTAFVEVNSWTTAEDAANRAIESITGGTAQGWSLLLVTEEKAITEISGHDYLFDLFSKMELFPELETQPDSFITYGNIVEGKSKFNPAEFLESNRAPTSPQREVPVDVPNDPRPTTGNNQAALNSNFSFGPPNIRSSSNPQGQRGSDHQIDPETGGVAGRIKGGGKMMGGMGTPMQSQMMMQQPQMMQMQQPQMMPMQQGMMQQPMMQQPMMQQPLMQQPMMQQPMIQQPMMQQPMMQQPMMQQPMMQQPMMQPPMAMQPQMAMPYQQMPMTMPGSIQSIANSMDNPDQQSIKQLKNLIKKLEEKQEKPKPNWQQQKTRSYRDDDDDDYYRRRSRKNDRQRDYSSDEDRRPSRRYRNRSRRDSSEEDRIKSSHTRSRRDSGSHDKKKSEAQKDKNRKSPIPSKEKTKPRDATPPPKIPIKEEDESDDLVDLGNGQGTVRMSFKEKRKFFEQQNLMKNQPPPRKARPKTIVLPKAEERTVPTHQKEEEEDSESSEGPKKSLTKEHEEEEPDTHAEALKLVEAAKRRSQKESKDKTQEAVFLARQRREAAARKTSIVSSKSSGGDDRPYQPRSSTKITPKRMTPVKSEPTAGKGKVVPAPYPSSSDESEDTSTFEDSRSALAMALNAKRMRDQQTTEENAYISPPSPPPPPPMHEEQPPPLPPPMENFETPSHQALATDADTRTVLHRMPQTAPLTYTGVTWRLFARKELFFAGDYIKNEEMTKFVFKQIVRESRGGSPRVLPTERELVSKTMSPTPNKEPSISEMNVITKKAMEKWPIYFTRIFEIKVTDTDMGLPNTLYQANSVGVGLTGVHFIIRSTPSPWTIQSYHFSAISQVKDLGTEIRFQIEGKRVEISCRKAIELGRTLRPYMIRAPPRPSGSSKIYEQAQEESEEMTSYQDRRQEKQENIYDVVTPPKGMNLSLVEYGQQHFVKKKDVEKALMYSKSSMPKPFHEISDPQATQDTLKCFKDIQQFMGDASAKTSQDQQLKEILGLCNKHRGIVVDEVSIYLSKQTKNNGNNDSLVKGWRLFALFLAFYKCSDLLLRYLLAHLHSIKDHGDEISKNGATVCLVNLQHTMDYGGRRHMPSDIEIRNILKGRATLDQSFYIPGIMDVKFEINTSSVIADAVKYFCGVLGIRSEEAMKEYGVFRILLDKDEKVLDIIPERRNVYLLDIISNTVKKNLKFLLSFQRVVWKQPINYDNENMVISLFHQVVSEYADGKYLTFGELTETPTASEIAEYSKMAALIHRGFKQSGLPVIEQVKYYIPDKVSGIQSDFVWKESVHNDFMALQQMTPAAARSEVLALLSNKQMFGSSIFNVEIGSSNQMTKTKIFAVNSSKIFIMETDNHHIEHEFMLSDVQDVSMQQSELGSVGVVDINIRGHSQPLRLKSKKAAVVCGVLNHHIHI